MPHIRMRAISKSHVQKLSENLLKELAQLINTPEENFTLELISTQYFSQGKEVSAEPFIEVLWFSRPQGIQDQVASLITEKVKILTRAVYVTVVFHAFEKTAYYEDGNHF